MHSVALLRWWYSAGWVGQLSNSLLKLRQVSDTFSVSLLVRTLFQPFKQLDTGSVGGSLDMQLRAWADRLLSRLIGAMVRSVMIILGCLWWLVWVLVGLLRLGIWPILPLLPVVGVVIGIGWGL